jgi:hypothetical protein
MLGLTERLVVAVEGETEPVLFPRVMRQLGVPTDDDFMAIEDAGGADRDLSPLVAYAVAPRVVRESSAESGRRYVRLERPPTRLLVDSTPKASSRLRPIDASGGTSGSTV